MISETHDRMELLGKSKEELREFCVALGEPAFRGAQIYHGLYSERKFDVAQITNLPAALRERLGKETRITLPEVKQLFASTDGSVRYLFGLGTMEEDKDFNAGRLRRGLPFLLNGAARIDSQPDGGRDPGASFAAARKSAPRHAHRKERWRAKARRYEVWAGAAN